MKKSELRELVLEAIKGYSKYAPGGTTSGGTTADFAAILKNVALGKDQVTRGNDTLDKANPDNVAKISRGEKPIYEGEEKTYIVYYYTMDKRGDDLDWDEEVQATSEEDAIAQVKAKGIRNARAFSAKLK